MITSKRKFAWVIAGLCVLGFATASCGGGGGGGGSSIGPKPPESLAADFTTLNNVIELGEPVYLLDTSKGKPTQWEWDFDDDGTVDSTEQNPEFTFATKGSYSVRLTVTSTTGSHSLLKPSYVHVVVTVSPVADLNVDADRDGTATNLPADQDYKNQWTQTHGAVFYHNIDDDSGNGSEDHMTTTKNAEDAKDLARVLVRKMSGLPAGGSARIELNAEAQGNVRIYRYNDPDWITVYSNGSGFDIPLADIEADTIELGVEGRMRLDPNWDGYLHLTFEVRESGGGLHSSDEVMMRQAPPLFATNLWETRELHVVNVTSSPAPHGNAALLAALDAMCNDAGITLRQSPGTTYQNDRWLQDSSEPGVTIVPSASGPRRVNDYVFQALRNRPVDEWCRQALLGPDWDLQARFGAQGSSLNYGGNIEVVPPHNGQPWGRMLIGGGNGNLIGTTTPATEYMDNANREFFDANPFQGPHVQATTEWLAVGHIDEYTMFVPAPSTARGHVCLIASPMRAWNQLVAMNTAGKGATLVFEGRTTYGWQTTVGAIVGNGTLGTYQQQVQARIDQGRSEIKAATGLTDADFIELPVLFENVGGGYQAAMNPGVVNLICVPRGGTTYFAVPDPEGPKDGGVDIWRQDVIDQLSPLATAGSPFDIRFVDVFYSYHDLLGEAHCGTNTARIPPANEQWWDK